MSKNLSKIAQGVIGSEIVKISNEINEKKRQGEQIYNLSIGDFDPKVFPVTEILTTEIKVAYDEGHTNYPPADGVLELREAVSEFHKRIQGLRYDPSEILIAGGARPIIYSIYKAIVDPGDKVIFPTPSWNNNHYTYLSCGVPVVIETKAENNFMPTAKDIEPFISDATLIALCSPQNPTGTMFTKIGLRDICMLILEENAKRKLQGRKPAYLMYDQIYWLLTGKDLEHYDPVTLFEEMREYTIYVDGVSKSLSATGIRVGWGMGPKLVIDKMKAILTHVGAWAPKAEQVAVSRYFGRSNSSQKNGALDWVLIDLQAQKKRIEARTEKFAKIFNDLKTVYGYNVDVIKPQGAIYLSVKFGLKGLKKENGETLITTEDVRNYLLNDAKVAVVPFYAFGSSTDSDWYRISIGTCSLQDIDNIFLSLKSSLSKLK
jgi:aspartate aminotransferase